MSCRSGRGKNSEYFRRDSSKNSRTLPFCSNTRPFHSSRKMIGVPTSHVVSRSEPYCHCLTRSGTVKASQTFLVGAIILTIESDVFTCTSPGPGQYHVNSESAPGRYCSVPSSGCYFERQSGFGGTLDDIIAMS